MKFFITVLAFFAFIPLSIGQLSEQQFQDHLKEIEGLDLAEITTKYKENIQALENFMSFFLDSDETIKSIAKEDESYDDAFNIDTTNIGDALTQFKAIKLLQEYTGNITKVEFDFSRYRFQSRVKLGNGVKGEFIPQKIYYSDGTTKTDGFTDHKVSFFFARKWGAQKPIDSIRVRYEISYPNKYDSVVLSAKKRKVKYKGNKIQLLKIKDNYAYLKTSEKIKGFIKSQAINLEGKTLKGSSSSSSEIALEDQAGAYKDFITYFKEISTKLNNNDFASVADFKAYLIKKRKNHKGLKSDGFDYQDGYYTGNINEIKLFFEVEEIKKTVNFTAVNYDLNQKIIQVPTQDHIVFKTAAGKTLFNEENFPRPLEKLVSGYYKYNDNYYHVHNNSKQLDSVKAYKIKSFTNGLVAIQPNYHNDNYALFSDDNKAISEYKYLQILELAGLVFAETAAGIVKLDRTGKETKIPGVDKVYKGGTDMIMVQDSNDMIGFMNTAGKMVTKMEYYEAGEFKEGLSYIRKSAGLYGFINKKGEVVLPFIYETAYDFVKGVTAVEYDGSFKLIDKKGTIIVNTDSNGVILSTSNNSRTYNFDGKKYDTKGVLLKEE